MPSPHAVHAPPKPPYPSRHSHLSTPPSVEASSVLAGHVQLAAEMEACATVVPPSGQGVQAWTFPAPAL